jgi:superfamily II DNA or RNA helicase
MNRNEVLNKILNFEGDNFLLELPTGFGKSKVAIELIKKLSNNEGNLLIVVPRNVLKTNWHDEMIKWWSDCQLKITYSTYVSLPKMAALWDYVIFDECHHLSERCRESLSSFGIKHAVLCSATVSKNLKFELNRLFNNLVSYKKDLRDAIDEDILPDPKVYLWPLQLDNSLPSEIIIKNPRAKGKIIECSWAQRWEHIKQKHPIRICCTERQYYSDLCNQIDYWKKMYLRTRSQISKNRWLRLCADRLKWISDKKVKYMLQLLPTLNKYRTLTFCNSIEQTEVLGKFCINSKNANSMEYLEYFNNGTINHITACNMINEGLNLTNCQVGIYANLNSSETIIKQRVGRILRHPKPVIIVPYYQDTREVDLVKTMLKDYNPKLVNLIHNINEIEI